MALTDEERSQVERQVEELETQIKEQEGTGEDIELTLADLKEQEKFNKGQWNKFHLNILHYEQEITGLVGEYVVDPISENDVQSLAGSGGRLYQNPEGTDAKKIPQFNGAPVKTRSPRELTNKQKILDAISLLRDGTGNSGSSEGISGNYSPGDATISFDDPISSGWVLAAGTTLLKLGPGSAGGQCSNPTYTDQASCTSNMGTWTTFNSYPVLDRVNDRSLDSNDSATPNWLGFTDLERTNKDANNNNQQQLLDDLIDKLEGELDVWQAHVRNYVLQPARKNRSDNMDAADLQQHEDDDQYVTDWKVGRDVSDSGLADLESWVNTRDTFRVDRAQRCRDAKGEYYGQRLNFTNLRADVQSGTLKRITFLSGIKDKGGFKPGGTKEQQQALVNLKKLLAEE